ncbi:MAG TPA: hypothetical protein VGP94_05505 [Tepidisphaeraceae bacterium]|jgi:hypothetical protein|nr:hypothetical protein [Tepidisphaeraceae bacterium]
MRHIAKIGLGAVVLALAPVSSVKAAFIPYPTPGIENPVTYTFTAASTGHVIAYFAGSTASFENVLGMSVNGGAVSSFGLDNQTTPYGTSFDLGAVTAGDSLVFVMHNVVPGLGDLYSNPALNGPYDGEAGHNHIYSTPFITDGTIPTGTFVSFEDLPLYSPPDWNYNDEDFVFTNIGVTPSVPIPAAVWGGIVLIGGVIGHRRLRRRPA